MPGRMLYCVVALVAILALATSGCSDGADQKREAELERRVAELERKLEENTPTPSEEIKPDSGFNTIEESAWQVESPLYIIALGNTGAIQQKEMFEEAGIARIGLLGRSTVGETVPLLSKYREGIENSNTIFAYNIKVEPLSMLGQWPEDFAFLLPLALDEMELESQLLPFLYFQLDLNSPQIVRGVLIVRSPKDATDGVNYLLANDIQLGEVIRFSDDSGPVQGVSEPSSSVSNVNIQTLEGDFFTVYFPEGYEADSQQMMEWAEQVLAKLLLVFPDILDVINLTVQIQLDLEMECGQALSKTGTGIDPSIYFPPPSVCAQENSYFDDEYHLGNIAHEFSHIVYYEGYRKAYGGTNSYTSGDIPGWFSQGVGEYFRLLVMGEEAFDRKYSRYELEAKNLINHGFAGIDDVYGAGAWILRFLADRFGIDVITGIMKSPQATFWGAFEEETGLTASQLEEQLKVWLEAR